MAFPKLYMSVGAHNDQVRRQFADAASRPLIIVGNGPSAARPLSDRFPADPIVFRMNWFFLEDQPRYGHRVDGFFWSVDTPALQDELATVVDRRRYDIRAFFSPMRPTRQRAGATLVDERFQPAFDHWALLAESSTFAREMMGRPLPTQGFQVLAFALSVGFREIYLAGIDLYESKTHRYGYRIPPRIAKRLARKDIEPGYEDAHSRDRDIRFLATCRAQFPEATLHALSDSPFLRTLLEARSRPSSPHRAAARTPERRVPRRVLLPDGTALPLDDATDDRAPRYCKLIDGNRCAYVTLAAGGGFEHGVRALAASLARVTDVPLVALTPPGVDKGPMFADNIVFCDISPIDNPNQLAPLVERFRHTYSKLNVFGLTAWDRLVYLDADTIVLQNIDELFDIGEFAAAPDLGVELHHERFNSGVFCCQPSRPLFEQMLAALAKLPSYDGGDQGFLNAFFDAPRQLDPSYNVLKRLYVSHPNLFSWEETKVLHFVGRKPWETLLTGDARFHELERRWLDFVTPQQVRQMAREWYRDRVPEAAEVLIRKLDKLRRDPIQFLRDTKIARPFIRRPAR